MTTSSEQETSNKQNITNELSESERIVLNQAEQALREVPQGKFIKFKPDERKVLYFLIDKLKIVNAKFDPSTNEYSESKEPQEGFKRTFKFAVIDPDKPEFQLEWTITNYETVKKVITSLKQSKLLRIKRIGEGKNTIYDIEPINQKLENF